jgi:serine/threonine-protein kinase PknK
VPSARVPPSPSSPELTGPRLDGWALLARAGAGASGTVFHARRDGVDAALKVAHATDRWLAHEAALVARIGRRWGPALLASGRVESTTSAFGTTLEPGARWLATTWIPGTTLQVLETPASLGERRVLAATVAHGVGRGLAELHAANVRHGDVKPANILIAPRERPTVDHADERGATLVDLDLATELTALDLVGGTPRYLAPELERGREPPSAGADLYALGLALAEILVPDLGRAPDLERAAVLRRIEEIDGAEDEVAWLRALLALGPGARPSAAWIAQRAASVLGLAPDARELVLARRARVERTYLATHAGRLPTEDPAAPLTSGIDERIEGVARGWLTASLARLPGGADAPGRIAPLAELDVARWIVSLVGPVAAAWPVPDRGWEGDGALAERLLALADRAAPEAWTSDEVAGIPGGAPSVAGGEAPAVRAPIGPASVLDHQFWVELARGLAVARPTASVLEQAEEAVACRSAPPAIVHDLAAALLRRGDIGRAFSALATTPADDSAHGQDLRLLRAEIARRQSDGAAAAALARSVLDQPSATVDAADRARALLSRLSWDEGDLARAEATLADARGPQAAEVRALIAYARGEYERGITALDGARRRTDPGLGLARLEGTLGMLEHARGRSRESLAAFERAVDLASRSGAVIEEATYTTGLAAAAVDGGAIGPALLAALRGALLWERLGRPGLAARAHLSRAAAFALVGAEHEAGLAAEEARRRALASNDPRAAAFARWAIVETRPPGDERASAEAVAAAKELAESSEEDRARALARLVVWAPEAAPAGRERAAIDEKIGALGAAARWEWWGARAWALGRSAATSDAGGSSSRIDERRHVLGQLLVLLEEPAPIGSRGPALAAAAALARDVGDGEAVRRIESARRALALTLREGTPPEHRAGLGAITWLDGVTGDDPRAPLAGAQVEQLEAIVRALSSRDRLKPLLAQVVDTMVLWTGVERGLLLLRAPDGHLVPRAARNLAREDLAGEQLALSTGLARRAMADREAICATDAFAQVGDLHASVHALRLRSVLAVPLVARGDVLGVVYLDDRVRRGAFGPGELAWVRLVASQAALAIADARDQTLLRRAARRAERASARLAADLGAREAELATVRAELASAGAETRFPYEEIAGRSEAMRTMLKVVDRVTMSEVPVLLAGESGTGKELVARAIHRNGPRGAKSFVSENCGSVPETLLESTLFGHVRGAFTGASTTRAGLFDVADGGTLLLDEIGEMPLSMQTKLLRVLQNGEIRPVGGERSRTVNVRIIGATHRDLEAMVAAGTFREDLFYRLNVVTVRVPPLRERREDIPLLVSRFVDKYSEGRKVKVTRAAMDRLLTFPWPGNVRQLENEVRRALVLADDRIDSNELSEEVSRGGPSAARDAGLGLKARVDALEAQLLRDALLKTSGNQTRAAEVLGISRFGLQKMMRRLGIKAAP